MPHKLIRLFTIVAVLAGLVVAAPSASAVAPFSPVRTSTTPANGSSVQAAPVISATYDRELDPVSSITLSDRSGQSLQGEVGFSDDKMTITFTPPPSSTLSEGGSPYRAAATVRTADRPEPPAGEDPFVDESFFTFTIDRTPPAAPTITSVDGETTSPATGKDTTPAIVVGGVVSGDSVQLFDGANAVGDPKAAESNSVTFNSGAGINEVTLSGDGSHELKAQGTDPAGNVSSLSSPFVYVLDTTAPDEPTIQSVHGDTSSPAVGNDTSPTVVVTGVVAGDTVTIKEGLGASPTTKDQKVVPAGADSVTFNSGATVDFTVSATDGDKILRATSTDPVGNESDLSDEFLYTLDTTAPPVPTIDSVHNDTESPAAGNDPTPRIVVEDVVVGDRVQILVDGVEVGAPKTATATTVVFNNGDDAEVVLTNEEDDNALTATATDPAENESAASATFLYDLDTSDAGPALESRSPEDGATVQPRNTVTATFDKALDTTASTISVTNATGNALAGTTSFSPDGKTITFTSSSTLNEAGSPYDVAVSATSDVNGETILYEWTFAVDATAPDTPTIDSVHGDTESPAAGNDTTPTVVVGDVAPGENVRLSVGGVVVANKDVPEGADSVTFNGGEAADFTLAGDGEKDITATATDVAGNESEPSADFTYVLDTTAPAVPVIGSVNGDPATPAAGNDPSPTIVVNGVVAGDTVRILEGETVLASKVVPASATTVTFNAAADDAEVVFPADGDHVLTATSTDPAGNESAASASFTYALDTADPELVSTSPADGSTVQPPETVSATFDEALAGSSTIVVKDEDEAVVPGATTFTDADKTIVFTPSSALGDGPYAVEVTANDTVGNSSDRTFSFTVDTNAPAAPAITSVHGDASSPATGNDPTPTIVVSSVTAGDTVTLREGETVLASKPVPATESSVTFNAGDASEAAFAADGNHAITATATDQAGNPSPASVAFTYVLDRVAPTATATAPSEGSTVEPPATVSVTYDEALSGTSTLTLKRGDTAVSGSSALSSDGRTITFTPSSALGDGAYTATAVAQDLAGNSTNTTFSFTVEAATTTTTTTTTTTAPANNGGGSSGQGYSLVGGDGSLYAFGTAKNVGDMRGKALNAPIIGVAYTPGGNGYWLVARDGGIFTFGDADFFGSMGASPINSPVIGMAATPTGKGYWLFAGDGGIFTFGDATFFGSMGDQKLNQPVINMEPLTSGNGYWLVAADGGIFTFGQADFFGSMGDKKLNQPVFDMTSSDTDNGYWLVARDGGIFSFGDAEAKFFGSAVNETPRPTKVIGMDSTPNSQGYWIADATGRIYEYGNARDLGDRAFNANPAPMVAFATVPQA